MTLDEQTQFLEATEPMLAAEAWKGYRRHGRGCLVVAVDDPRAQAATASRLAIAYIAAKDIPPFVAAARMAASYRPASEIVVVFMRVGERVRAFRRTPRTPPPQAFAENRNSLGGIVLPVGVG